MQVASLHVFPVKSLAGFSPRAAVVRPWGLEGDRRFMVVRPDGRFLTQRDFPGMAVVSAAIWPGGVRLSAVGRGDVEGVPEGALVEVAVWNDRVLATGCGAAVDDWLSELLGTACRLVFLDDPGRRKVGEKWRLGEESVSFADGFPVLLTSLGSLADVNGRMARPVGISRFRGNIVVEGAAAWDEDFWGVVRVGDVRFRVAKPCERCVVTTVEQETGTRPDKNEPLRTLGVMRRDARGVMFGQNLIPLEEGEIFAGDAVEVLERGAPNVVLL
jgi:uncharacterized protein YcbX